MSQSDRLKKLQQKYKEANTRTDGQGQNNYYPFWNMEEGEQAVVRFLPDKNPNNPYEYLLEKFMHTLTVNGEKKSVPCLKNYGRTDCPICKVSAAFYKQDDKENGLAYWRKKQFLAQALIVEDPLPGDKDSGEKHEGKIRYLALGNKLHICIQDAIEGGELDEVPFDYEAGTNFIIKKTKQGTFADYSRSKFQKHASALEVEQVEHAQSSIIDLSTLLPKQWELEKMEEILEAALSGKKYEEGASRSSARDEDEQETRVSSVKAAVSATSKPATRQSAPADDIDDDDAERILETIRNRKRQASSMTSSADIDYEDQ